MIIQARDAGLGQRGGDAAQPAEVFPESRRRITLECRGHGASALGPTNRLSIATFADDIYAGLFVFAGRSLAASGGSPFDYAPPSPEWADALYGFGWLRHLRAADTALARANARAWGEYLSRPAAASSFKSVARINAPS